ncbi:hypothetical protein FDECE_9086, partial [Fusarium decemcellulare]
MSTTSFPDLVQGTRLTTYFEGNFTVHHYDESDDENDSRPTNRSEFWEHKKVLGEGGGGTVCLQMCAHGKRKQDARAVKFIRASNWKAQCLSELETIARFSQKRYSKYFVKMLGWYEESDTLCIAMEHLPLGDLQQYVKQEGVIPEPDVQAVIHQVLEGLDVMHCENFAHRDIKPGNILIKAQPPRPWWVKISDFGISKRLASSMALLSRSRGTMLYMAPELPMEDPEGPFHVDYRAADLWSLGIMVFYLLTQTYPFPTHGSLSRYLSRPDAFPSHKLLEGGASAEADSFIRAIVKGSPDERPSSSQALSHRWLQALGSSKLPPSSFLLVKDSVQQAPSSSHESNVDPWATQSSAHSSQLSTTKMSDQPITKVPVPKQYPTIHSDPDVAQLLPSPPISLPHHASETASRSLVGPSSGSAYRQQQIIDVKSETKAPVVSSEPRSSPLTSGLTVLLPLRQRGTTSLMQSPEANQEDTDARIAMKTPIWRSNINVFRPWSDINVPRPAEDSFPTADWVTLMRGGDSTIDTAHPLGGWHMGYSIGAFLEEMNNLLTAYSLALQLAGLLPRTISQLKIQEDNGMYFEDPSDRDDADNEAARRCFA